MADNRNNDQSLITNNNYNNRDNSTSSNTDMYLEQVANSLSSVAEGMKNLQKQLSDSNKESANQNKKLIDSLKDLNETNSKLDRSNKENTKAITTKEKLEKDLRTEFNSLTNTIKNLKSGLNQKNSDSMTKDIEKKAKELEKQIKWLADATEEEAEVFEHNANILKASADSFGNQVSKLEDEWIKYNAVKSEELAFLKKKKEEFEHQNSAEAKMWRKKYSIAQKEQELKELQYKKNKNLAILDEKANEKRLLLENKYTQETSNLYKKLTKQETMKAMSDKGIDTDAYKKDLLTKLDEFTQLQTNAELDTNNFFKTEISSLIAKMGDALATGDIRQYDILKKSLDSYNENSTKANEMKGINPALFGGAGALVSTFKQNALNIASQHQGLIDETNARKTNASLALESINNLLNNDEVQLTEDEKENLNKQKELLQKQEALADTVLNQFNEFINAVSTGNKKDINAKQKALAKTVKQFDKISEDANNLNTQLNEHIQQTYGVRGTIATYLGKALKTTLTAINNYARELQVNALNSLQAAYEGSGQDIMKRTLSTRYEVLDMIENIGNELENKIRGIDTTEVLQSASSLADAGIRNTEQYGDMLTEMSAVIAEMSAFNPDAAAEFYDEENLRTYYKIWVNAADAGKDGAEALRDYLYKGASEAYLATQAVGNSFWSANGRIVELDTVLADAINNYGLTTERADEARKAIYGLGALVGTDITDFNAWITEFMNLPKEGIKGEAQNIIQGVTHGEDIINAINSGNFKDAMIDAYSSLLTYGQANNFNYDESYKMLMNTLGIDSTSISKIVNDKQFFENGIFSIEKFLSELENVYAEMENTAKADEKYKEIIVEGKGQTVENKYQKEAINDMTDAFANIVETDMPKATVATIAAIEEASSLINKGIDSAVDALVNVIAGSGSMSGLGSMLGGAGGGLGSATSSMGIVGKVAAPLAAGIAGYAVGTYLNQTLGISDKMSEIGKNAHTTKGIVDNLDEYLESNLPDTVDALNNLNSTMEESNTFSKQLVDFEKARLEEESETITKATGALSINTDFGGKHASAEQVEQAVADGKFKEAQVEQVGAYIAGGALQAQTADERNTYIENMVKMLESQGWSNEAISVLKENIAQYYDQGIGDKEELDKFNADFGKILYQVYKRSEELKANGETTGAWDKAFAEVYPDTKGYYVSLREPGADPIVGTDIEIDEESGTAKVLPGAYTRKNAVTGEKAKAGGYLDYMKSSWGRFATGLDNVPYDDYPALLHRGERVLTATETQLYESNILDLINTMNGLRGAINYGTQTTNSNADVVNSINSQTSNMSSAISTVISILTAIANNTGNLSSGTKRAYSEDSYFTQSVLDGAMGLVNYTNPILRN